MADPGAHTTEEIRSFILANVDRHPTDIAALARDQFAVSRQAVNVHLHALEADGQLISEGRTRGIRYRRAERLVTLATTGLQEHDVYREHVQPVLVGLPDNVENICAYGVTEMVNNAIDHSGSATVTIGTKRTASRVDIRIKDEGIGIFRKIQKACQLEDVRHAVFELTKGKLTTDPTRHTGEGIFFTSRMVEVFTILSFDLFLRHGRSGNDWLLQDKEPSERFSGTSVGLQVDPNSTHTAKEVFDQYAVEQDDFAFNKTHVVVELAKEGEKSFVSRSQAKRIVARLDKFKEVVLDFTEVEDIGPAFADEIFRVFTTQYPGTHLIPVSMNEQVTKMVRRATFANGGSPPARS